MCSVWKNLVCILFNFSFSEFLEVPDDPYAFLRIVKLSPSEFDSAFNDFEFRMSHWAEMQNTAVSNLFYNQWHKLPDFRLPNSEKEIPIKITSNSEPIYGTNDIKIKCMKETLSHRVIRSKKNESALGKSKL